MSNPFKGLEFLGHLLPALPLYAMGIVTIFWGFHALPSICNTSRYIPRGSSDRSDLVQMLVATITGVVYAAIHLSIVFTADNDKQFMDNIVHSNIGIALALGGVLHWVLSRRFFDKLTINFSLPMVFIAIGFAIGFHQDHTMRDPANPDGPQIEDTMSNIIHTVFGGSMALSGVMTAVSNKYRRWQVLEGIIHILTSALLTVSTKTFLVPTRNNHIGIGNLITFCLWFAVIHALGIGLYVHFSGKAESSAQFFDEKDAADEKNLPYAHLDSSEGYEAREVLDDSRFDEPLRLDN